MNKQIRKTKNFKDNRARHHPNRRLLLGIAAIGILALAIVALGPNNETLVVVAQTP